MTCGHWNCMPKVVMQELSRSHNQILLWINMVGDISCCTFLHLECVINFTENGPFKDSPIVRQLASHTHTINALPIKSFSLGSNSHTKFLQYRPQFVLLIIHTSVGDLLDESVIEMNKTILVSGMTSVLLSPFFWYQCQRNSHLTFPSS